MLVKLLHRLKVGFNRRFLIKTGIFCLSAFLLGAIFSSSSYSFAYERQNVVRCLPQVFWLLDSDVNQDSIQHGDLVKLNGHRYNQHFGEDIDLLKMVVALEGDTVTIDAKARTFFINGLFFGTLPSDKPAAHNGAYTLKSNEIWLAGTSDTTIDSRYFGPATLSHIEAHAYAIL